MTWHAPTFWQVITLYFAFVSTSQVLGLFTQLETGSKLKLQNFMEQIYWLILALKFHVLLL